MPEGKRMHKWLAGVALSGALGLASNAAMAVVFNDFNVDWSAVNDPANPPTTNTFTADKITGNYNEIITFGAGTFDVALLWNAGQFVANDGTLALNAATTGLGAHYELYALYQGKGTFSTSGSGVTTFSTTPGVGGLSVFIDPNQDTTFTAPGVGSNPFTTSSDSDDFLVSSGVPLAGGGTLDPTLSTCQGGGIDCGSFGTATTFSLTVPKGTDYFTFPSPFYNVSFNSGQLNNFSVSGTQSINGSMDVVFTTVPEPGTLALLGVALLGAGVFRRKRTAA